MLKKMNLFVVFYMTYTYHLVPEKLSEACHTLSPSNIKLCDLISKRWSGSGIFLESCQSRVAESITCQIEVVISYKFVCVGCRDCKKK